MSTDTYDSRGGDARRAAIAAERGASAWQTATTLQRKAAPDHAGFYALAGELVATLRHLDDLCDLLTAQVSAYGHTVTARGDRLVDDEPGHDAGERVAIASSWAAECRRHLITATSSANVFWSEVGHLAVDPGEVPR